MLIFIRKKQNQKYIYLYTHANLQSVNTIFISLCYHNIEPLTFLNSCPEKSHSGRKAKLLIILILLPRQKKSIMFNAIGIKSLLSFTNSGDFFKKVVVILIQQG